MKTLQYLISGLRPAFSIVKQRIVFPLLFLGGGLALVQPCEAAPFQWEATGSLNTPVVRHSATLLTNGKVLVAGGTDDHFTVVARTVLYDPANGTWAASGNLIAKRSHHTATLLPNGTVLVAAGVDYSLPFGNQQLASAELYDPATGIWTNTGALAQSRADHTATLLPNGKVLIAGGDQGVLTTIASCELYD